MSFEKIFANILDLPGVEGAVLFGTEGRVVHNAMPAFMSEEALGEAQRRIFSMYETMDENFLPCEDYTMVFEGHLLILRKTEGCLLLVLGTEKMNQSSLRMVTNMAMKRFGSLISEGTPPPRPPSVAHSPVAVEPPPPPVAELPPPPPARVASSEEEELVPVASMSGSGEVTKQRKARFYRGQIYYDDE